MSITKKWLAFCLAVCMIMPLVAGCGEIATKKEDGKLHIVTTVFPYYDFAKQIGGDRVSVDLIVPAGMDTHSFEPTAKDMVTIGEADVFIYNGGTMESWVPKVLEAAEGKDITTLRMMDHVKVVDEEIVEGMQEEEHEHEHADGDHDDAEETEQDEHIWTAPLNCVKLVDEIAAAFAKADPDHSQEYLNRAEQYTAQLKDLDMQIRQIVAGAQRDGLWRPLSAAIFYRRLWTDIPCRIPGMQQRYGAKCGYDRLFDRSYQTAAYFSCAAGRDEQFQSC